MNFINILEFSAKLQNIINLVKGRKSFSEVKGVNIFFKLFVYTNVVKVRKIYNYLLYLVVRLILVYKFYSVI